MRQNTICRLTPREQEAYDALVASGPQTGPWLALRLSIGKQRAATLLRNLLAKGYATKQQATGNAACADTYSAVDIGGK